ncbi:unnamed protein product [Cuscuta epithymum]|uniref:Uncharacterized protein n=1 Tax=Cuscuta epithymum TaxID=186058 RepID=A0AAV0FC18_9ASTE|nr:unnamed protein product [Cuscuta epithymum]
MNQIINFRENSGPIIPERIGDNRIANHNISTNPGKTQNPNFFAFRFFLSGKPQNPNLNADPESNFGESECRRLMAESLARVLLWMLSGIRSKVACILSMQISQLQLESLRQLLDSVGLDVDLDEEMDVVFMIFFSLNLKQRGSQRSRFLPLRFSAQFLAEKMMSECSS